MPGAKLQKLSPEEKKTLYPDNRRGVGDPPAPKGLLNVQCPTNWDCTVKSSQTQTIS